MIETGLPQVQARLDGGSPRWFMRLVLFVTALLVFALAIDLGSGGVLFVFWRRTLLVFAVAGLGILLVAAAWMVGRLKSPLPLRSRRFDKLSATPSSADAKKSAEADFANVGAVSNRRYSILGFIFSAALMLFLFLGPWRDSLQSLPARFLVLWLTSLLASFFLAARQAESRWLPSLLFSLIIFAFLYNLACHLFMLAPTPFSLGWSEATRYYHASLILSERYYGLSLPLFYQDLSRYVVEVVPLLLPQPSLLGERAWEFFLRYAMPALTTALILNRLTRPDSKVFAKHPARARLWKPTSGDVGLRSRAERSQKESASEAVRQIRVIRVQSISLWLALFLWGTLFLLQGPVYFYLLPAALPILAFYHPDKPIPSILALLVASFWAGISRVNWIPVPAMLAIALYLLEVPIPRHPSSVILRYLTPPALYTALGLVTAYAARLWYADLSQISSAMFNASFIQQMLWYRLFPSSLNSWGILPSGLLMAAPLFIFIVAHLRGSLNRWHWIRLLGLGAMTLVLFAGGIIVSAKIGGGNNLHNLDGFSVLYLTIGLYLLFDRFLPDLQPDSPPRAVSPLTATLAILVVTVLTANALTPALPSLDRHEESLASLQQLVDETVADGGSVLFITQRHLLPFGLITGVPLVPEYDNIDLMEFAMTNYRPLIDQFHADIAAHKYAMIIAPIPPGQLRETDSAFSEENNAWLKRVSIPMLREYKILATFEDGDFVVLIPDN